MKAAKSFDEFSGHFQLSFFGLHPGQKRDSAAFSPARPRPALLIRARVFYYLRITLILDSTWDYVVLLVDGMSYHQVQLTWNTGWLFGNWRPLSSTPRFTECYFNQCLRNTFSSVTVTIDIRLISRLLQFEIEPSCGRQTHGKTEKRCRVKCHHWLLGFGQQTRTVFEGWY